VVIGIYRQFYSLIQLAQPLTKSRQFAHLIPILGTRFPHLLTRATPTAPLSCTAMPHVR
jgi:hypothetical protein